MKHFLLFYELRSDYLSRRPAFRQEHLALAWASQERGELVLAGALAEPVDSAVFLFRGDTAAVAADFAKRDPYVLNGLVASWKVREWTTVVGEEASTPVRPAPP